MLNDDSAEPMDQHGDMETVVPAETGGPKDGGESYGISIKQLEQPGEREKNRFFSRLLQSITYREGERTMASNPNRLGGVAVDCLNDPRTAPPPPEPATMTDLVQGSLLWLNQAANTATQIEGRVLGYGPMEVAAAEKCNPERPLILDLTELRNRLEAHAKHLEHMYSRL